MSSALATGIGDLSLEMITARLAELEQDLILDGLDLDALPYDWHWSGRPSQILPVLPEEGGNDWDTTLFLGGRGTGKSRSTSEWIRSVDANWQRLGRAPYGTRLRISLLGRTASDVRDTMVQGESGLLNVYPPSLQDLITYTPSRRRIDLPGGAHVTLFSADEPDQLRGPQSHIAAVDELASHKQVRGSGSLTAWENLQFGNRLGSCPQILAATTPRRVPSIKKLLADAATNPRILIRRGRTADNAHLDPGWYQTLLRTYAGTEKGRQELDGEVLGDVAGAMTSTDRLNATRVKVLPPGDYYRFVGLDPSTSENYHDEAGIVVVYVTREQTVSMRHAYVLDDDSGQYAPNEWADRVVKLAARHHATIVAEVNQGGAMVKNSLQQVATNLGIQCPPIRETFSSKAKRVRAEPVGIAIARGRVHMVGGEMGKLEDEMTTWVPEDAYSPDRLDALVFAVVAGLFDASLTTGAPGTVGWRSATSTGRRVDVSPGAAASSVRTQTAAAARIGRIGGR